MHLDPPYDVLGNAVKVGDTVAAGMTEGRSSVLRVGIVEKINTTRGERKKYLVMPNGDWARKANGDLIDDGIEYTYRHSVTVRWTHTQNNLNGESRWGMSGKSSSIKTESTHTYAKLIVLPDGMVGS